MAMANRPVPIFLRVNYIILVSTKTQGNELLDLSVQAQDLDCLLRPSTNFLLASQAGCLLV